MAAAVAQSLSSLLQQSTLEDHEELLKAANNTLKKTKGNVEAQHVRLVALVKLDRYDEAVRVVEEGGEPLKQIAALECAYALYKNGRLTEAGQILANKTPRGLRHLAAQVAYRAEKFEDAARLFTELAGREAEEMNEESDLRINSGAVDAQLSWSGQSHLIAKKKPTREDLEQYETAFNIACGYIARGNLRQAEVLLGRASTLCKAADELSEEDKEVELRSIMAQQACVLSRLGKSEDAEILCSNLDLSRISDRATRHIAQVNQLATSSSMTNPYLAHRIFQSSSKVLPKDQLFQYQISVLDYNALALDLQASKYPGVASSTKTDSKTQSRSASYAAAKGVINAAAHARCQIGKPATKELSALLGRNPNNIGILLTLVQLHVSNNNFTAATSAVESFLARMDTSDSKNEQASRYTPGFLAVVVALYSQQGRIAQSKAELAKAAAFWKKEASASASGLKAAGAALLDSASPEDFKIARDIFASVIEQDPEDVAAIAGIVASTSPSDQPLPSQYADKLQPVSKLIAGIDVADLEEAGVAHTNLTSIGQSSKKRSATEGQAVPEKAKKSSKSKLPKDYDPNKAPDPERWLPLRDRSNYKPKGKKKSKLGGGTQGGITNDDSRPATPSQANPVVAAKPKKKKGKGAK